MDRFPCATIGTHPNGDNTIAYFGCYLALLASVQVWGSFSFNIPPLVYNSYASSSTVQATVV
ncbi:hypothetical protein CY34DRAFT_813831 [Suillus luteus UH-Slu-Lm8-n1]|uniref:Unplaced genomic scaffold CY34scaffold_887, whole genome shotgun sequence n=1 Tax=Suillus luteus UH-Slu-Lm8-n1 TaxID=930992 RepID=A0A0D0AMA5_9AGAM|nr:hypothetical protein CY34DRAFT_813831 [Suillus luteus UH-Slu-Lm8-n1]